MADSPRRVEPVRDLHSGDVGTLVALGWMDAPPQASADPPARRGRSQPTIPAADPKARVQLLTALSDAGVDLTARDTSAVGALTRMDAATVATVAGWIRRGKATTPRTS